MDGCGVRLGKHSPLFASLFPFFSQGQTESGGSCSCLSTCARVGEVDLCGLYSSRRESPQTNLPPGALGHWPPSLIPRDPQAAPRPPATSLILAVMRTPWRGEEYVSEPRKATLAGLENTTALTTLTPSHPISPFFPRLVPLFSSHRRTEQRRQRNAVHHVAVASVAST